MTRHGHGRIATTGVTLFGLIFGCALGAHAEIAVAPLKADLRGPEAVQQLLVADRDEQDLTAVVTYQSSDPKVATVNSLGVVTAQGDGTAIIAVKHGSETVDVEVKVHDFEPGPPIHFGNQIVPIFTKLGCNAGGCHGKASGQNGFRLSLLGFEPALDYETLVKEGRGRRLFPAAPDQSLLLSKATARVPHGGGKRLDPQSHEYRLIRRWIASGMPVGRPEDPTVARIEINPSSRVLKRGGTQQVAVTAIYSDGRREDVTRWAQYQSNELDVAAVADGGKIEARQIAGQAAVMARYQSRVAVFRATVPLGMPIGDRPAFTAVNFIDAMAEKQWKALGLVPSERSEDAVFIRRATLDICGGLPTAAEVREFTADSDPDKRSKLVDRLLDRPEYAAFFATKWADILRNKRENNPLLQTGTYRFHDWIKECLAKNVPYDEFTRGILAATGTPQTAPAVMWYRRLRTPDAFVDDTAQVFLGMRLQCAKCHHHPFEKWSEDDYYGFAAFFSRIGRKPVIAGQRSGRVQDEAVFTARSGSVSQPKTGKAMRPKGLDAEAITLVAGEDPRQKLATWMADPKNPFFARALVNRYWAHFFGRGIVEPLDDLRLTNPPANPELLDALAEDFIRSGFDLKHLVRSICASGIYGLSSLPNEYNAKDRQSFARHYTKRLAAEVLLDAISRVTGVPTPFNGLPAGTLAIELPDESIASTFLDTFGRPKRDSACECERVSDASLGQSLMLLNSGDVQSKLSNQAGRAESLSKDPRPVPVKIEELFWTAFARAPSSSELAAAADHLEKHKDKPKEAFEDIIWALINAKEFQFND